MVIEQIGYFCRLLYNQLNGRLDELQDKHVPFHVMKIVYAKVCCYPFSQHPSFRYAILPESGLILINELSRFYGRMVVEGNQDTR